jgi:pSer/pThr/pTyr-binding forkhead associated (FHA) protein
MGGYPILRVSADGHDVVVDQPVEVTVGRDPDADLSVSHPLVSRRHLVLRPGKVGWIVEDAGSTNGTFQGGRRISWLRIDSPMRLRLGDPDGGQEVRVEPVPAAGRLPAAGPDDQRPRAARREAPGKQKAVHPILGRLRLGRGPDNDIVVRDPTVSRRHAELHGDPLAGFEIVDRSSRNGTFVNGHQVSRAQLREYDRIQLGFHVFRLVRGGPDNAPTYGLEEYADRAEWWRLAATVAISVMTVFGAGLALWAAYLGTSAVDGDRRAVLETVRVEQQRVAVNTQVRAEESLTARYRATLAEADALEREAGRARTDGRSAEAAELADRVRVLRTVAQNIRQFFPAEVLNGEGAGARFNLDVARRLAMARGTIESQQAAQLDPGQTAGQAQQFRNHGLRLQAWSILLVVVLALLTFARISEPVRPWLAVTGMVLFVLVAAGVVLTLYL